MSHFYCWNATKGQVGFEAKVDNSIFFPGCKGDIKAFKRKRGASL